MLVENLASRFFGDRRLLVLIVLLILVAGLSSLAVLPRMEDPVLRRRVALVNTRLPGADAKRVETLITEKIEDRLRDVEEIKQLRSVSRVGISSISIELRDSVTETETVWSRVRSRLDDALPILPVEATRPVFEQMEVRAYALIVGLVWKRDEPTDLRTLRRLAIELQNQLSNVPGTDSVDRFGDPGEEIEVRVDPRLAASVGLTASEIADRLRGYDAKASAGQLRQTGMQMLMEIDNQIDEVSEIGTIPIAQASGRDISLAEVAEIHVGTPNPQSRAALLDGDDAVVLGAMVLPEYRIDRWTTTAEALLDEYCQTLPAGIEIESILRQSDYVNERLQSLTLNLFLGGMAVAAVICILMGWRSAMIVTLTLPLASLMVLFGLRVGGIPIHQMSVTGLIIALGLLIDNAIVMVDEVQGRLRKGESPSTAMSKSVSHLAIPLLGSTLTTALAFAPIALMPGPAGEFVGAIAISVILAIFASLFLAMSVIPTVAARVLSGRVQRSTNASHAELPPSGIQLPRLSRIYERAITGMVRYPAFGILVSLVFPLIGFSLAPFLKEQFFPASGRDQFYVTVEGPPTSSLSETQSTTREVDRITRELGVERIDWFYGESAPQFYYNVIGNRRGTANYSQGLVRLPSGVDPTAAIEQLQTRFDQSLTGVRVLARQLEQGPPFAAPIEVRLFGPDLETLRKLGEEVRRRLSEMPEVTAVRTDLTEVLPQISFDVDEAICSQLGITPAQIASQISMRVDGVVGGSVLQENEVLPIVVRVAGDDRADLASLRSADILVNSEGQQKVMPLSAIATVSLEPESAAIPRLNRRRMNEVAAYLTAGTLPSVVQTRLEDSMKASPIELPSGYSIEYGGEASKRDDAVGSLFSTVGVLAVLMLATLVLSFGSFRLAGIIAVVAFLAVGLGMAALSASGYPFGFMAIIGTMGLIGVAINDSIVVLAGIRANPKAVAGDVDSVVHEVMHATRHVVATTLTTMAGFTPLILDGGGFWPPMAVSIAGGVAGATLLALVLVPALHQWIARDESVIA